MKIYMIAKSNIKRNKGISFMLMILIMVATILLYTAFSVLIGINSFIDEKNKSVNGADYIVGIADKYADITLKSLEGIENYKYSEKERVVINSSGEIRNITKKEKKQSVGYVILNGDTKENLSKLKIIDKGNEKLENSIVLPYILKTANGYNTGDKIEVSLGEIKKTFVIYGFAEDIMFATPTNISYYKCYIYNDEFNNLYNNETEKMTLIKTRLQERINLSDFDASFVKSINSKNITTTSPIIMIDYESMKLGLCIFLYIMMAILIVFSIIIITIVLTVMRFTIVSHIESNIKNIGSMQAMGYRPKELIRAMVCQFILIGVVGYGGGFAFALLSSSIVKNIVSSSIGLEWRNHINILAAIFSLVVVLLLIIVVSYTTSYKIKRITPIIALRSGIETHNFKKSYFPLYKKSLHLNILLGLKSFVFHMKQNITIIIVVVLMSFVCVFAFEANYNFNIHDTPFLRLIGMEKAQLGVISSDKNILKEIDKMENVRKTLEYTEKNLSLKAKERELTTLFKICSDYDKLEISTLVKGRYPIHDNEIAVTDRVLKGLDTNLGEVIRVKDNDNEVEFLIVGITQQINYLGKCAMITTEGMKRLNETFEPNQLLVYLDSSEDIEPTIKKINETYKQSNVKIENIEKIFNTTVDPMKKAIALLCLFCIIITLSIISLILYLFIKIRLLKERVRIGAAKAIGYTTKQIIIQVIISFCPACIIGSLIGGIMAIFFINPAFAAMLCASGIISSNLYISPMLILITFLGISLLSIVITMLVSLRVRKITPCELF